MEFIDGEHFIDDESRRWLDAQNKWMNKRTKHESLAHCNINKEYMHK